MLEDFVYTRYPIAKLDSKIPSEEAEVVKEMGRIRSKNYTIIAKVGDNMAAISYTVQGIMAKCDCGWYGDEPCEHIIAAWQKMKEKLGDKVNVLREKEEKMYDGNSEDEQAEHTEQAEQTDKANNSSSPTTSTNLKDRFIGKLTVLFGEPMVGKTTFAMLLAKSFTHKAVIHIDKNYEVSDYLDDARVFEVYEPSQVMEAISKIPAYDDTIVIVDSITSLDAFFVTDPTKDDPRVNNRRARFCDAVMLRLQKFKKRGAVIVIAHEAIKNFSTGEVGPRMNKVALRHADQILRMLIEQGKRKLKLVVKRKPILSPDVQFEWE